MNTKQEVLTQVKEIIREHLGVNKEEISECSTWVDLGADSLDRLSMSLAIESALNVDIPHSIGERLNTVGETVDHLLNLTRVPKDVSHVQIEAVSTSRQWSEMSNIRTQVFATECGFSFTSLPEPGLPGVWHFLARDNKDPVGTLSVVDTTGNCEIHARYRMSFNINDRVARYAQLAILKPYRKHGIFEMLIDNAQRAVVHPHGFAYGWLLYPAARARSCMLTQSLGFAVKTPVLKTELGKCHALVRRESAVENQVKESKVSKLLAENNRMGATSPFAPAEPAVFLPQA